MLQQLAGLTSRPSAARAGSARSRACSAIGRAVMRLVCVGESRPPRPAGPPWSPTCARITTPAGPGRPAAAAALAVPCRPSCARGEREACEACACVPTHPSPYPAPTVEGPNGIYRVPPLSISASEGDVRPRFMVNDALTVIRRSKFLLMWKRAGEKCEPMRACPLSIDRRLRKALRPYRTFRQYVQRMELEGMLPVGSTQLARKALLSVIQESKGAQPATHIPPRKTTAWVRGKRSNISSSRPVYD